MSKMILLGDEAIAMGAIHAGISAAYGYPGTPSTEIMEFLQSYAAEHGFQPLATWCSNEKTAFEAALGVSMLGKRVLVTMKQVGLNVAADPFMNAANLKISGGLVLAVVDDPSMHASQNEQDSRFYADFAHIICLEPHDQQEAYAMTEEAFAISEKFHIPVMLKSVTRLAHSRALVKFTQVQQEKPLTKNSNKEDWIILPALARKRFSELLAAQDTFVSYSENSSFNPLSLNTDFQEFGVITTGLATNYYAENLAEFPKKPSHLHISVYPLPINKIRRLAEQVKKIIVLEEGYPLLEKYLRGILPSNKIIIGKQNNLEIRSGELTPDNIRPILGLAKRPIPYKSTLKLPERPPQLCAGCPHGDTFLFLKKALQDYPQAIVTSDIGCYSLGALPPYQILDSIVCMGASIGMAKGAFEAGAFPVIATIGDSTFLHSGIPALIDCVAAKANLTVIIMDNSTVAMTGCQETILPSTKLKNLILGIGVEEAHLKELTPLPKNLEENVRILQNEITYPGVSVIIARRACVVMLRKKSQTFTA